MFSSVENLLKNANFRQEVSYDQQTRRLVGIVLLFTTLDLSLCLSMFLLQFRQFSCLCLLFIQIPPCSPSLPHLPFLCPLYARNHLDIQCYYLRHIDNGPYFICYTVSLIYGEESEKRCLALETKLRKTLAHSEAPSSYLYPLMSLGSTLFRMLTD